MDNDSTSTLVYLDNYQATQFVLFQKYFIPFNLLCDYKVFEQKAATITIRLDKNGEIQSIIRTDLLYSNIPNFTFINPST